MAGSENLVKNKKLKRFLAPWSFAGLEDTLSEALRGVLVDETKPTMIYYWEPWSADKIEGVEFGVLKSIYLFICLSRVSG